jgi:cytochrome c553
MRKLLLCWFAALAWTQAAEGADELTVKETDAAKKIYVAKCAKCHKFYEPKKYSEPDWGKWMDKMSVKSKLKTDQDKLLRRYLDEYRAGRIPRAK